MAVTNEISKQYINDKVSELVKPADPLTSIKKIDAFLTSGLDFVVNELKGQLERSKKDMYAILDKKLADSNAKITQLQDKIQDYEQDLQAIEQLKGFKRKSKFIA